VVVGQFERRINNLPKILKYNDVLDKTYKKYIVNKKGKVGGIK
jgi:hypothetical protein